MTEVSTADAGRTGRPRSAAADEAILSATLELLRRHGYGGLTMTAVIERAGVSSATLYRRWATKHDLVVAALEHMRPSAVARDTGSLATDVRQFLGGLRATIEDRWIELAQAISVEAKADPEFADALRRRFLEPRISEVGAMLERARGRGELAAVPAAEAGLSLVMGPLHHYALILGNRVTDAFLDDATTAAVAGLQALVSGPRRRPPRRSG